MDSSVHSSVTGMLALSSNCFIIPTVHFHCLYPYRVLIFQIPIFEYDIFKVTTFTQRSYLISAPWDVTTAANTQDSFPQLVVLAPLPKSWERRDERARNSKYYENKKVLAGNMKALFFLQLHLCFNPNKSDHKGRNPPKTSLWIPDHKRISQILTLWTSSRQTEAKFTSSKCQAKQKVSIP